MKPPLRITCPDCGGTSSAVADDSGWLKCSRCGISRPLNPPAQEAGEWDAVSRFAQHINYAVRITSRQWGNWFPRDEARTAAEDLVIGYAGNERGPNDMGMLGDWETQVGGDQEKLNRIVLNTLRRDLSNAAEKRKGKQEQEKAAWASVVTKIPKDIILRAIKDEYITGIPWYEQLKVATAGISAPSAEDVAIANITSEELKQEYPLHYQRIVLGLTDAEIGEYWRVTARTVARWRVTEREQGRAKGGEWAEAA